MAFAFVASGSGYCILKMNNFMQLLILLLFMGRGACTSPTGVRIFLQADIAGGGDENRRRKINWKAWAYDGLPDVVEKTMITTVIIQRSGCGVRKTSVVQRSGCGV